MTAPVPIMAGAVFISGDDADDFGHCQGTACGALYPNALRNLYEGCQPPPPAGRVGILAVGVNGSSAASSLTGWNAVVNGGPGAPITVITTAAQIGTVVFEDYRVLYIPSSSNHTSGGITTGQIAALNARQADIANYVNNNNGRILALTEDGATGAFGWLPAPLTFISIFDVNIDPTPDMDLQFPGSGANAANMDHCCYHTAWTGPPGYSGLNVLAVSRQTQIPDPSAPSTLIDAPVILGGCSVRLTAEICGDGIDNDGDGLVDEDDTDCHVCGDGNIDPGEECDDGNVLGGDGCDAACQNECQPDPRTQGYWHRQCLGTGEIRPGRLGRGPTAPTEPDFVSQRQPCADAKLEDLNFYATRTCEGLDANPPSDPCERALKQLTAMILNACSDRLQNSCSVTVVDAGCTSTTVADLFVEIAALIQGGSCETAAACAAAVNEGTALPAGEPIRLDFEKRLLRR